MSSIHHDYTQEAENVNPLHAKTFNAVKRAPLGNIANVGSKAVITKKAKLDAAPAPAPAAAKGLSMRPLIKQAAAPAKEAIAVPAAPVLKAQIALPLRDEIAPMDIEVVQAQASGLPENVENIDMADEDNPLMASEYVEDIYDYMRELELRYAVNPSYLERQPNINRRMRAILVDWLVEVHNRFDLLQETLFLTVNIMDRYLEKVEVARNQLQLVGVTAMLLASKYEEMYPPEIGDFVYISDNAYTREQILSMEQHMLRSIDFSLGNPLPLHFLRRVSKAGKADANMHTLAKYIMELTLCSAEMLSFTPSKISAAATFIAREVLQESELWNPTLEYYSKYSLMDIQECVVNIQSILKGSEASKQQAVRGKFAKTKFLSIAENGNLVSYIKSLP